MINNANFLWFDATNVLEQFLFDGHIDQFIGTDLSIGFEYRPLLSENVNFVFGLSALIPGQGFRDLYNNFSDRTNSVFIGSSSPSTWPIDLEARPPRGVRDCADVTLRTGSTRPAHPARRESFGP